VSSYNINLKPNKFRVAGNFSNTEISVIPKHDYKRGNSASSRWIDYRNPARLIVKPKMP